MAKHKGQSPIITIVIVLLALFGGFQLAKPVSRQISNNAPLSGADSLCVHYIDVGQGDSALITLPNGKTMLIDAGDNGTERQLISYLKSVGISQIDYLVGTHPHSDHIGGMQEILESFPVGKIFMPRVTHTSQTYIKLLETIQEKNLSVSTARQGKLVLDEGDVHAEFLAPCSDSYEDLNNYSAVLRLTYQDTAFLFMGDAETLAEREILSCASDVSADVLKVGHHGSSTSTSKQFLDAVSPDYAVISCGSDNSYGHPHRETLESLEKAGCSVLRTDETGTILIETDGNQIRVNRK